MKMHFVYTPHYDFSLFGLDKLHPFDGQKYSKAWKLVVEAMDKRLDSVWKKPDESVSDDILRQVHTNEYLASLNSSETVAKIMEFRLARFVPSNLLQSKLLRPARYAVQGTLIAAKSALKDGIALNFGGGFHHAFPEHGEGFCFFADAALSIQSCRTQGILNQNDNIVMIDLDAHRGNGFEHIFRNDPSVHIFDMYNFQVYPGLHPGDPDEFPFMIPMRGKSEDEEYLNTLTEELPKFLNQVENVKLAFYNAGTDVLEYDRLGGLNMSFQGVVQRDRYVLEQLIKRQIPTVIMTSGGYSKQSHELIAQLAIGAFEMNGKNKL